MGDLNYDASSIKSLSDKEAMQTRTTVYIGSTDIDGVHHTIQEVLSNSIDEYMNGFGKVIHIHIYNDGSISITDEGRGIPVGLTKDGQEALEVTMTVLHGGAKFNSDGSTGYNSSGGLNGIGLKAPTYLSEFCIATVCRDGKIYELKFIDGEKDGELSVIGESKKTGTKIYFKPSLKYFDDVDINSEFLIERIKELSYLTKGLTFIFCDERNDLYKEPITFLSKKGLLDYAEELNDGYTTISKPFYINHRDKDINCEVEAVLQYNNSTDSQIKLYTNNIPNPDGGTHYTGFSTALTRIINAYGREKGLLKEKDENFSGADLKEGQVLIINVKMPEPQFGGGNTKYKLNDKRGRNIVEPVVNEELKTWLSKNTKDAKAIITKILETQRSNKAAKNAKEKILKVNNSGSIALRKTLGDKFKDCLSKDISENELLIVEGLSAMGSILSGRDPKTQAVLALRGKLLNTMKETDMEKILSDKGTIKDIILALGTNFGSEFNLSKLRFGKIIIATDSDVDGSHIRILILTLLFKYFRPLIEKGHVFSAVPPLYKLQKGSTIQYVQDDKSLSLINTKGWDVTRFKGLGELSPKQISETVLDIEKRKLRKINIIDEKIVSERFEELMGKNVLPRKIFIENNADRANINL